MKLTFASAYKSIGNLSDITLPTFTVLTGKNGSGKSQLLQAISLGRIITDVTGGDYKRFVRLLDFQQIGVPSEGTAYSPANVYATARERWGKLKVVRDAAATHAYNAVSKSSFGDIAAAFDQSQLIASSVDTLSQAIQSIRSVNKEDADALAKSLANTVSVNFGAVLGARGRSLLSESDVAAALGGSTAEHLLASSEETFLASYPVLSVPTDAFAHRFSEVFAKYIGLYMTNHYERLKFNSGERAGTWLTDDDFFRRFGPFPWDLLNSLLDAARLPLEAIAPRFSFSDTYTFQLRHKIHGTTLATSDLSSGERVLLSFALCLYHASTEDPLINYPKVLLLDEIDASLHPSMVRVVLNAIVDVLVAQQNVSVVLATHSPTTVAIAPPDSIHVVSEQGSVRLAPIAKDKAIAVLTAELPSLSIDFENRRQIFVESSYDAQAFETIFEVIRTKEACPISITFVSVDPVRNALGGCDRLRGIVKMLRVGGNNKIFGIVDWDANDDSEPDGVLKFSGRYSIENWVLDPIVVASALLKHERLSAADLDLPVGCTYRSLQTLTPVEWQKVILNVERRLEWAYGARVEQAYGAQRLSLSVDERWCHLKGHDLEARIGEKIPQIRGLGGGGSRPLFVRTVSVMRDYPELIPTALYDGLKAIANE